MLETWCTVSACIDPAGQQTFLISCIQNCIYSLILEIMGMQVMTLLKVLFHVKFYFYRYLHEPNSPKKKIVRNREFEDSIREEEIEMPTQLPPEVERKSIQERIQVYLMKILPKKIHVICYSHVGIKVGPQH